MLDMIANNSIGDYWIVNKVLSKGLHNADQESLQYTTTMMDKLEQVRRLLAVA